MENRVQKALVIADYPGDEALISELFSEPEFQDFSLQHVEQLQQVMEYGKGTRYPVNGRFEHSMLSHVVRYAIKHKKLEESHRESEERLLKKNKEILEFIETVLHDMKNPLFCIKTVHSILSDVPVCTRDPGLKIMVENGRKSIGYMEELLADLLSCAGLESGTQKIKKEECNIKEIIREVASKLDVQIAAKKITLSVDADGGVYADRKSLTKIFINLIGNAVKYIGEKDNPHIAIGASSEKNEYRLFVKDTGIGIPGDSKESIFEKFKRGSNAHKISGTGLGLPIVKAAAEAHGGKVWIDSTIGTGTTVYFTLPKQCEAGNR